MNIETAPDLNGWPPHQNGEKLTVTVTRPDGKSVTVEGDSVFAFVRMIGEDPARPAWQQPTKSLRMAPADESADDAGDFTMAVCVFSTLVEHGLLAPMLSMYAQDEGPFGVGALEFALTKAAISEAEAFQKSAIPFHKSAFLRQLVSVGHIAEKILSSGDMDAGAQAVAQA